jgi:hypothetical protein
MPRRLSLPLLLVLVAAAAFAMGDAIFAPSPAAESPDFIDTLLASRAVVAAIRAAIIFASGFVVASVVALSRRGQWLTRVGSVQVAEVSDIDTEIQQLKESLEKATQRADNAEEEMAESILLFDQLRRGAE